MPSQKVFGNEETINIIPLPKEGAISAHWARARPQAKRRTTKGAPDRTCAPRKRFWGGDKVNVLNLKRERIAEETVEFVRSSV